MAAYGQYSEEDSGDGLDTRAATPAPIRISDRPALDYNTYKARTTCSDMRLIVGKPDWKEAWYGLIVSASCPCASSATETS